MEMATGSDPTTTFGLLQDLMHRHCGVVLAKDQAYLVESRLGSVVRALGLRSIDELVRSAASCTDERSRLAVIDAMTTHETLFFRDASFWSVFERDVLGPLLKERDGIITIWSAACSTGQEPYSIAMLLQERFPEHADRVRLIASDVSALSIRRAKAGVFSTLETNRGLSGRRLVRFFQGAPGGFVIDPKISRGIEWRVSNIVDDVAPAVGCDVVMCRNVLIYFDATDRERAVNRLISSMRPNGYLGLGSSELLAQPQLAGGWYQPNKKGSQR
jgi:chemotaxis protein methyltransferase CheR